MKILPVGAKLFHANGQTDMSKLVIVFRNFEISPKNLSIFDHSVIVHGGKIFTSNFNSRRHAHSFLHSVLFVCKLTTTRRGLKCLPTVS